MGTRSLVCAEDDSRVYRVSSQRKSSATVGASIDPREDRDVGDDATFALRLKRGPPDTAKLLATLADHGLPSVVNQRPFYGRIADAPARPFVFAGRVFRLPTSNPDELPPFSRRDAMQAMMLAASDNGLASRDTDDEPGRVKLWALRPIRPPPSRVRIDAWLGVTRSKSINLVAAPDAPVGATPSDRTEAARKSVADVPPPSPFFNPPGGILRMSAVAAATHSMVALPPMIGSIVGSRPCTRLMTTRVFLKLAATAASLDPHRLGLVTATRLLRTTMVQTDDRTKKPAVKSLKSESSSASPFPHRPPSPKYDDPSGFIELLRYDGCEAHPDELEDHAEKNVHQRISKSKSRSPASITRSARRRSRRRGFSQLTPPDTGAGVDSTPNSDSVEFRSQGGANTTDDGENGTLNLGVMCVECIGDTRGDLLPNPRHDSVLVIAMRFSDNGGVTHTTLR